ncbi:MAG: hypothetical protein ABH824_04820 [Nanoarchaeota archaeon]|nr:hypothetical protein [Nanoarchaeota archaeon]MBU1632366.1 hypothetical protein [Nanoarchaeota archaeon]MBU1875531.1 hypothetical protein [Nanoarchaeota archaeon]
MKLESRITTMAFTAVIAISSNLGCVGKTLGNYYLSQSEYKELASSKEKATSDDLRSIFNKFVHQYFDNSDDILIEELLNNEVKFEEEINSSAVYNNGYCFIGICGNDIIKVIPMTKYELSINDKLFIHELLHDVYANYLTPEQKAEFQILSEKWHQKINSHGFEIRNQRHLVDNLFTTDMEDYQKIFPDVENYDKLYLGTEIFAMIGSALAVGNLEEVPPSFLKFYENILKKEYIDKARNTAKNFQWERYGLPLE